MKPPNVMMVGLMTAALDLLLAAATLAQPNNPPEAKPRLGLDPVHGMTSGGLLRPNLSGIGLMEKASTRPKKEGPRKPPLHKVLMAFVDSLPVGEIGPFKVQIQLAVK